MIRLVRKTIIVSHNKCEICIVSEMVKTHNGRLGGTGGNDRGWTSCCWPGDNIRQTQSFNFSRKSSYDPKSVINHIQINEYSYKNKFHLLIHDLDL